MLDSGKQTPENDLMLCTHLTNATHISCNANSCATHAKNKYAPRLSRVLRSSRSVLAWHVVRVSWRSAQALVHPPGSFSRPRTQAGFRQVSNRRSIYHLAIVSKYLTIVRIFQLLRPRVTPHPWYADQGVYRDQKWRPGSLPSRSFRVMVST